MTTYLLPRCPRVLGAWVGCIDERFEFNRRCRSAHSPNLSIRFSTRRFVKLFVKPFKPIVSFLELICQIFSCINKSKLGNFGNFCFPSVNLIIVIIYYYYLEKYPIKTNHVMTIKWYFSLHCPILHVFGWGHWFFLGWWILDIMIEKRTKVFYHKCLFCAQKIEKYWFWMKCCHFCIAPKSLSSLGCTKGISSK